MIHAKEIYRPTCTGCNLINPLSSSTTSPPWWEKWFGIYRRRKIVWR
jgi:hypothetical protein